MARGTCPAQSYPSMVIIEAGKEQDKRRRHSSSKRVAFKNNNKMKTGLIVMALALSAGAFGQREPMFDASDCAERAERMREQRERMTASAREGEGSGPTSHNSSDNKDYRTCVGAVTATGAVVGGTFGIPGGPAGIVGGGLKGGLTGFGVGKIVCEPIRQTPAPRPKREPGDCRSCP